VSRANLLVFSALIGFLTLIAFLTWDRSVAAQSAREWTEHSYQVLGTIRELEIAVRDAETGQRGYLLTGNDDYLASYDTALNRTSVILGELQRQTADNADQQARLRILAPAFQRWAQQLAQAIQVRRDMGLDPAIRLLASGAGRETMAGIEQALTALTAEEQTLLSQRLAAADSRGDWVRGLVLSATAIAILALLWAAQRGGTLTGQLLAFARKQPLAPTPIDLSIDQPELVPLLRRTLGEHIDVRFVDSAGLWPAMADPAQLEGAVLNPP
jgi:CHASE3 domain sensor protein